MAIKVLKSYGTQGDVIISITGNLSKDISTSEPVFINFDELPVPFFIEKIEQKGSSKYLVKLEDIDTFAQAEEIVGREIYLNDSMSDIYEYDDDGGIEDGDYNLEALVGFKLHNQENEYVGVISGYYDIPNNPCLEVRSDDERDIIIPLHDDLILDFKPRKRILKLQIPEGLI